VLRRAEKINPNNPFVNANLGYAIGDTGHPAESLPYLRRAIGIKWDMAHPWSGLVRFFSEMGQHDAARTALGILRMLDPVMASRASPWAIETW